MKHTQGPWKVERDGGEIVILAQRDSRPCVITAELYDSGNEPTIKELEANAALIAAAPELLEACKILTRPAVKLEQTPCGYIILRLSIAQARQVNAAITKAVGK